jgi:pyruvate formate lyase activating enzyme
MVGLIFNIKKYAIHDGPGIRVTFFLKGCSLNCWWCHNPEGISPVIEQVERVDRIGEEEFRKSETVGKLYSVADILSVANRESIFFEHSGGGVTFSGGEPMLQFPFLRSSLKALNEAGYHTAVDTSGVATQADYEGIFPFTSLFLYDIKHMNDAKHQEYTGVSNKLVLSNYRRIIDSGIDLMVRIPIIPGYNDDQENLKLLRGFLGENISPNLKEIDLLPFHKIGSSKYRRFGMINKMEDTSQPSEEAMARIREFFGELGVRVKIGG